MKSFFVLLALSLISLAVLAQSSTAIKYYNGSWKECKKDTATYISKVYRAGNTWSRKDYWIKSMQLQSEENFLDAEMKRPADSAIYYNEEGVVTSRNYYENEKCAKSYQYYDNGNKKGLLFYTAGKPTEQTGWYENGNKRGLVVYDTAGKLIKQTGWDENGVEIPDYIYEQEARFPGGPQAWQAFLVSKINPNTAATKKTPKGVYTVKVQFIINKEGKVERAQAVEIPALCARCRIEAVKIINSSPRWEYAIQYGKPVIYQAIQYISWQVED